MPGIRNDPPEPERGLLFESVRKPTPFRVFMGNLPRSVYPLYSCVHKHYLDRDRTALDYAYTEMFLDLVRAVAAGGFLHRCDDQLEDLRAVWRVLVEMQYFVGFAHKHNGKEAPKSYPVPFWDLLPAGAKKLVNADAATLYGACWGADRNELPYTPEFDEVFKGVVLSVRKHARRQTGRDPSKWEVWRLVMRLIKTNKAQRAEGADHIVTEEEDPWGLDPDGRGLVE